MEEFSGTYEEQEYQLAEIRRRKNKMLALFLLLFLLLLLGIAALAYLFFRSPSRPAAKGRIQPLFSIYGLDRPMSASTDAQGRIYVSDTGNARFMVFDENGEFVRRLGNDTRALKMYTPFGSWVDDKTNRVYIADYKYRAVHVYSTAGKLQFRFPPTGNIKRYGGDGFTPYGIDEYQNRLYVTSNDGIYQFTKQGRFLRKWGEQGQKIDQFLFPDSISIDQKTGDIYVADTLNKRVKALDAKGNLRWTLGRPDEHGEVKSFLALPRSVFWDAGRQFLFVVDTFNNRVVVLSRDGKLISMFGERGVEDGQINFPEGLSVRADHSFVLADRENNRVQVLEVTKFPVPRPADVRKYEKSFIKAVN